MESFEHIVWSPGPSNHNSFTLHLVYEKFVIKKQVFILFQKKIKKKIVFFALENVVKN